MKTKAKSADTYEPLEIVGGWAWYLQRGEDDSHGEAVPRAIFNRLEGKAVDSGVFTKKVYKTRDAALDALRKVAK